MKALAETSPVPGHTNGRGLDQYQNRRGHCAGSTASRRTVQNRTAFLQSTIGTVTHP
jgi:hypothetical protein